MKKIHLIETLPDGLRTVQGHLADLGGKCAVFSSVNDALKAGDSGDLVILLAHRNLEYFKKDMDFLIRSNSFSRIPLIVCLPFRLSEVKAAEEIVRDITAFELPVNKLSFLSTVARYLKVPPRRVLQIVITIQSESNNLKYTGTSIDFSETGVAFKSNADFPVGHTIAVNFVNPSTRKRLFLKAKVVRRTDIRHDRTAFYGVMFIDLAAADSAELKGFVTGGR